MSRAILDQQYILDRVRREPSPRPDVAPGDCWIWLGSKTWRGYGLIQITKPRKSSHRAAFEMWRGPIAPGLVTDHLCRVRACCNPQHIEPVTNAENSKRGAFGTRTHCPQGHAYDAANTIVKTKTRTGRSGKPYQTTSRDCRECTRASHRRRRARATVSALPASAADLDPHAHAAGARTL